MCQHENSNCLSSSTEDRTSAPWGRKSALLLKMMFFLFFLLIFDEILISSKKRKENEEVFEEKQYDETFDIEVCNMNGIKLEIKEELSLNEVKMFSTSSLITRTTNDITQVEMLIAMGLQLLIKAPITAVWAVTKILNKNFEWSVITAIAVLILLSVIAVLTVIVLPKFKIVQKLIDKLNCVTRENLSGIRVIRAFNAEKYQKDKFWRELIEYDLNVHDSHGGGDLVLVGDFVKYLEYSLYTSAEK